MTPRWSRRQFLARAATSAVLAPLVLPASALGRGPRPAPSGRVHVALIGCGDMGASDIVNMLAHPACEVVALCDVDRERRETLGSNLRDHLARTRQGSAPPSIALTGDFRDVIARPDVDAVIIATPDHWHAAIAVAALNAGKDVYGEKPLALTLGEGAAMQRAVRRNGRVFQHGTQSRSNAQVRHAVELVRNGRIGQVRRVQIGCTIGSPGPVVAPQPVPEGLDFEMWLGPAPWAPYHEKRVHHNFRYGLDYSGGSITDLGTHYCDVANWGCDKERTGPVEMTARGEFPRDGIYNTAVQFDFECRFEDGLLYEGSTRFDWGWGVRWIGDEGWIHLPMSHPIPPRATSASDPRVLASRLRPHEWRAPASDNHWTHFIDCVLARAEPVAPIEVAHRSASIPHLANLAMQIGRPLRWDPRAERFHGDDEANARILKPYRGEWTLS